MCTKRGKRTTLVLFTIEWANSMWAFKFLIEKSIRQERMCELVRIRVWRIGDRFGYRKVDGIRGSKECTQRKKHRKVTVMVRCQIWGLTALFAEEDELELAEGVAEVARRRHDGLGLNGTRFFDSRLSRPVGHVTRPTTAIAYLQGRQLEQWPEADTVISATINSAIVNSAIVNSATGQLGDGITRRGTTRRRFFRRRDTLYRVGR
jgi:hypothetical protein